VYTVQKSKPNVKEYRYRLRVTGFVLSILVIELTYKMRILTNFNRIEFN